jgi:peptidoglycan/xylan/chitin deacetylase (PgdA/CDA1 family)
MSVGQSDRPTLLVFHKLVPVFTYGVTNYSPRRFRRLLESLVSSGWTLDRLDRPTSVPTQQGRGCLAVCFDDGYEHLADVLPELVDEFHLRPVIFMPTELEGRSNQWDYSHVCRPFRHLSRGQIRVLSDKGVVFGSHGASHRDLTSCTGQELSRELSDSRNNLQDWSGQSVEAISYPFGRCDRRVCDAAEEAGYRSGYTMRFPSPKDHSLSMGRVPVYGFDTPLAVRAKLGDGFSRRLEQAKSAVVSGLSGGTVWLNRLRGREGKR